MKALHRWVAGLRQIIETVYDKLLNTFRLHRERPHALSGFLARLAAKMALHNFCIWLNQQASWPPCSGFRGFALMADHPIHIKRLSARRNSPLIVSEPTPET